MTSTSAPDACQGPAAVCQRDAEGAVALITAGTPIRVIVGADDHAGVQRAANDLRADLAAVAGALPDAAAGAQAVHAHDGVSAPTASVSIAGAQHSSAAHAGGTQVVLVGTLGHDARIDRIVRTAGIDTTALCGRWEGYLMQVVEHPEPGIARALLIVGADKRGTIFGIYELSRRIGVSPWNWWADVAPRRHDNLHVLPGRLVDAPVVRYRGIFINDEEPALGSWMRATYGGPNHRFYERVFALVLRLKGNLLWPAMWGSAFADDDPRNAALADEYGVVVGTSHHEPMMRAHVEWARHGGGAWDYTHNAPALQRFWRDGITRMGRNESLVTIGMRGDGDEPMGATTAIGLLETIVADQRRIIAETSGKPAPNTPQVWALYKEVQDYYDAGMRVPDDVTLLFADDNWGNLRRLPAAKAVPRSGGSGVYYHLDYVGGPRSYKWLNTNQIERVWEQMRQAHEHGADRLWIVNVGDIKPMEFPTSFFLDMAWSPPAMTLARLRDYPRAWAAAQFGDAYAEEIGALLTAYTRNNARRKPELLGPDTFSLLHHHEATRVLADWQALAERAQALGATLPERDRAAYFQLVEYPVVASANLNALYIAVARNRLYAAQGRASADAQAALARTLFARDATLAAQFEAIGSGKWTGMMSQTRIGYTDWQQPDRNVMPALAAPPAATGGQMPARIGVAVEGDARAWPGTADAPRLPPLEADQADASAVDASAADASPAAVREITVFRRGASTGTLRFDAVASEPWLHVSPASGGLGDDVTLQVSIDAARLSAAAARNTTHGVTDSERIGTVTVRGSDGTVVRVVVPVKVTPADAARPPASGAASSGAALHAPASAALSQTARAITQHGAFIETDGRITIEAAHFTSAVDAGPVQWVTIPHLGRTLSGVTTVPSTAATTPVPAESGSHADTAAGARAPTASAAHLGYPIHVREDGEMQVTLVLSPALDINARGGVRIGISTDDGPVQTLRMQLDPTPEHPQFVAWKRAVSDAVHRVSTTLRLSNGAHVLRLWRIDPGVVVQRIEMSRGQRTDTSYLGPPESPRR